MYEIRVYDYETEELIRTIDFDGSYREACKFVDNLNDGYTYAELWIFR